MIVLYNVSILFAWRVTLKRERAAAAQLAREAAPAPSGDDDDGGSPPAQPA
jgi:hypothetical protein